MPAPLGVAAGGLARQVRERHPHVRASDLRTVGVAGRVRRDHRHTPVVEGVAFRLRHVDGKARDRRAPAALTATRAAADPATRSGKTRRQR